MKILMSDAELIKLLSKWRKKFALLPTTMTDGSVVWLEYYEQREEYSHAYGPFGEKWDVYRRRLT